MGAGMAIGKLFHIIHMTGDLPALEAWYGLDENLNAGQQALHQRARCNGAASTGTYTDEMDGVLVGAGSSTHRREWDDD